MPSAYLQWRFHSGEQVVARGPLVELSALDLVPYNKVNGVRAVTA